MRSGLAGFMLHGPLSHCWYIINDKIFVMLQVTQWWNFIPKMLVDQFLWGPVWNAIYIIFIGLLKSQDAKEIYYAVTTSYYPLLISSLKLWGPVGLVTYGVIKQEQRLLWVDCVEVVWVVILSTQAAKANKE